MSETGWTDSELADRVEALAVAVEERYGGLRVAFNHGGVGRDGGSLSVKEVCDLFASRLRREGALLKPAMDMKRIVEEIDGSMRHGTWRDEHGVRLKDTDEWVEFYNAISEALRNTPLASPVPAVTEISEGAQTSVRYRLEWIAAPRHPVHPNPMKGTQSFKTMEAVREFWRRSPGDSQFVSLTEVRTIETPVSAALLSSVNAPAAVREPEERG